MSHQLVRYIGFDMDDCVGGVHPLHPFTNEFASDKSEAFLEKAAAALALSERERKTDFLRSGITDVFCAVYDAIQQGQIRCAFLFSNNDNQSLVEFTGMLLETMVQRERRLPTRPRLFGMIISVRSPEREPDSKKGNERRGIKDWEAITRCLAYHRLPTPSSKSDLLFFDDKEHALTKEITHYTVVPAYHATSSLEDGIRCIRPVVPDSLKGRFERIGEHPGPPGRTDAEHRGARENRAGSSSFLAAIRRFLSGGGATRKKTREAQEARKTRRRKTRKNRRQ